MGDGHTHTAVPGDAANFPADVDLAGADGLLASQDAAPDGALATPQNNKKPFGVYFRILHAYTIIYSNIGFFARL